MVYRRVGWRLARPRRPCPPKPAPPGGTRGAAVVVRRPQRRPRGQIENPPAPSDPSRKAGVMSAPHPPPDFTPGARADLSRRQVLKAGATGAGAYCCRCLDSGRPGHTGAACKVLAVNDLALWYDERPAPTGCGRCRSATDGSAPWCSATSTPSGCSSTRTPSGPAGRTTPATPAARRRWRRSGGGSSPNQWTQAQDLINQTMLGSPVGQLAYQPVGNLRLTFPAASGVSQYNRTLDLTTATDSGDVRAERRAVSAGGVRQRTGPGDRDAPDRRPRQLDHVHRRLRQPAADDGVQPGRHDDRPRRRLRQHGGPHRFGPVPRPGQRDQRRVARSAAPAARCGCPAPPA